MGVTDADLPPGETYRDLGNVRADELATHATPPPANTLSSTCQSVVSTTCRHACTSTATAHTPG